VREAVAEVVKKQVEAGIDLVNDGEMSKPSYATYIKDRLAGFGGTGNTFVYQDLAQFPRLEAARVRRSRPLAPQDAGLQRADRRARCRGRSHRRRTT
jgi:methionine synthase II (cobalamin-independent)